MAWAELSAVVAPSPPASNAAATQKRVAPGRLLILISFNAVPPVRRTGGGAAELPPPHRSPASRAPPSRHPVGAPPTDPSMVREVGRRSNRRHSRLDQPSAATATTGWAGGWPPSDPTNGDDEKSKMPPSAPTMR